MEYKDSKYMEQSRVLLYKLIVSQLAKKFAITRQWTLSWATWY